MEWLFEEDPKRVDSLTDRTIKFIEDALKQERPFMCVMLFTLISFIVKIAISKC